MIVDRDRADRPLRRRHGVALREAICVAALAELGEHGYAGLTMGRVAARAHTSKATLYRHWPGKVELVVAAFESAMPQVTVPADRGDLRAELFEVLRQVADGMASPSGGAARELVAELVRSPALARAVRPLLPDASMAPMLEVLRRAVVRGETPVCALTPRYARVGTELVHQYGLGNGVPIPDEVIIEIVDDVLFPLLRGLAVGR